MSGKRVLGRLMTPFALMVLAAGKIAASALARKNASVPTVETDESKSQKPTVIQQFGVRYLARPQNSGLHLSRWQPKRSPLTRAKLCFPAFQPAYCCETHSPIKPGDLVVRTSAGLRLSRVQRG